MKPTNKRLPALRFLKLNEGQLPGWPARASRTVSRGSHPEGRSVAEDPRSGLTAAAERARGERVPSEARAFRYAPHPPTPVSGEPHNIAGDFGRRPRVGHVTDRCRALDDGTGEVLVEVNIESPVSGFPSPT